MSVGLYAFSALIGMGNRLFTPPIDDREGMGGGGEGTSATENNVGMEWFSAVAVTVYIGA